MSKKENRTAIDALESISPQEAVISIDDMPSTFPQGFIPIMGMHFMLPS
jgi:hypothetical protein